jgi:hypothetical protein
LVKSSQALAEQGFDGMAHAMELLMNECTKVERQQALGLGTYQRGEARHLRHSQL